MPQAGFEPGSSAATLLEFERLLKLLGHHDRFQCMVLIAQILPLKICCSDSAPRLYRSNFALLSHVQVGVFCGPGEEKMVQASVLHFVKKIKKFLVLAKMCSYS